MNVSRGLTRLLMGVAIVCGSIAWTGWAYLHTVAAPHRIEDVADAVLADPDARFEIAGPLADQIVSSTGVDASFAPQIRDAVAGAMADPRVAQNVTAAFGSMHARAVGVPDDRPATIDGALLVAAVKEHLAVADPALAAVIPDTIIGQLHLPEYHPPFVAALRRIAVSITNWLALAAFAFFAAALIIGDRKYALRRFGIWAIVTGALWAIGPRIVVFLAHRWTPDADATIDVAVGAATKMVVTVATALVVTGIGAIVLAQFAALGQYVVAAGGNGGAQVDVRSTMWRRSGAPPRTVIQSRPAPPPAAAAAVQQRPAPWDPRPPVVDPTPIVGQVRTVAPVTRVDTPPTFIVRPSGWGVNEFVAPLVAPAEPHAWPPVPSADDQVDPWAHFAPPAAPPAVPRDD